MHIDETTFYHVLQIPQWASRGNEEFDPMVNGRNSAYLRFASTQNVKPKPQERANMRS
jgi:hypothetical protein